MLTSSWRNRFVIFSPELLRFPQKRLLALEQALISLELHGHPAQSSGEFIPTSASRRISPRSSPRGRSRSTDLAGYDVTDGRGVRVRFEGNKCNRVRLGEDGTPEEILVIHATCSEAARDLDHSETSDHREITDDRYVTSILNAFDF